MEMASSEVEMSSCQTFNCALNPHEKCIRGDNNKKKNKNNNNVRNLHVAFEKNLNVFVRDHLENCSVSGVHGDDSTKAIPECSSDHLLSKTEESRHEVPSSSSLGSDPDPNFPNPGQPDKNSSRKETMAASSLVQIWEARTTQQPPSSNQSQSSQIDSRTSSSGSNVLENSESLNEESVKESADLIQTIEEGNNEEAEEKMECDIQFVPPPPPDSGDKEREGVRVMDIIRKLSSDPETSSNNDNGSSGNDNSKEVQTETKCFPQVACSPRIRGRQAFADLLVQMTRDREKELASLSDRHSVSKFTHRRRIQSTLRIRCYERCIAIQDKHRSGSDLNRSPRGSGVMHLLREKYKTSSDNIETGVSSWGRTLAKDTHKASEKKVLEETVEKSDVKEVISAVETTKKAVLSETVGNKNGLKKSTGEATKKENAERRGEMGETKEKAVAKETAKKAVLSESAENKSGLKKPGGEAIQKETTEGRGEKGDAREKAIVKEIVEGNALVGLAEKMNPWNSEEKLNRRRGMAKGKTESNANAERVEKIDVLEEATRRIINVESAERSITTQQVAAQELKETAAKTDLSETRNNKNGLKKPTEKENREGRGERREMEESVEGMGIAEKVNLWNSKEKKNRRRVTEKGKGKTEGKANTEANQVLQEASRRISNVETAERSLATSKETVVENVVGAQEMKDKRETTRSESEEKGRRKKEEEFASVETKSKDIIEVKNMNPLEVTPAQESAGHGTRERAKEKNSSQQDEKMSTLRNPDEENGMRELEDEETNKEERGEKGDSLNEAAIEFVNDENEMEEEEDEYGDYDHYSGENMSDWIYEISRPRSYWEDLRKERYLEVLNTESEKKDICNLIESQTVSNFLTSELRQKIDNLMITRVQTHLGVPIKKKEDDDEDGEEEEEEWVEESPARNQEDNETEEEPEKTNLGAASDGCSQSSAWSFRDQDIDKDHELTTSFSLPEPSIPTNQSTQEMQMISDLRGQMEQLQREVLELRNSVKSCVEMQLHFQKSLTQDHSRSGSSAEQRVDTNKDPLKRKCCVCLELPVDSLLYRCGHMCTCLKCAHELQWSSKKCPICMAPIVDVVRAFLDS
ncbi:unnamed protein product [Thlaspi arvense]|uniref:RING-type domain-containing protein n=1 Tax=Thlaspi arvense TaxID=13288 RepID=A0AAU9T533_THLAR|nr:unnamed protein product [Thlaspi arvense]